MTNETVWKKLVSGLAVAAVAVATGCDSKSEGSPSTVAAPTSATTATPRNSMTEAERADSEPRKADASPASAATDPGCSSGYFVQLATVMSTTPKDYGFPITRDALTEAGGFTGLQVVETKIDNRRVMGVLAPTSSVADRVIAAVRKFRRDNGHPAAGETSKCMSVDVTRVVFVVP